MMFKRLYKKKRMLSDDSPCYPDGSFAALPGGVVLEHPTMASAAQRLLSQLSAPQDVRQFLYHSTLEQVAELLQWQPFRLHHDTLYVHHQFQQAERVLKRRAGMLLPPSAEAEVIAAEEAKWTYAAFSLALLVGLEALQQDRHIELLNAHHERVGMMHPCCISVEAESCWRVVFTPPSIQLLPDIVRLHLASTVIPPIAFRWLYESPALFEAWWTLLSNPRTPHYASHPLAQLVREAGCLLPASVPVTLEEGGSDAVLDETDCDAFLDWLWDQVTPTDDPKQPPFLKVVNGLWISKPLVLRFAQQHHHSEAKLLERLAPDLILNETSYYHRYRPVQFEDRRLIEGIVMAEAVLPFEFAQLACDATFQPEIVL